MKKLYIFILSLVLFFLSTYIIKANQVIFNDNFDDQSFYDWTVVQNESENSWGVCVDNASVAKWRIDDGWLGLTVDGTSCTMVIKPSQFNLRNQSGYQFEFDWRFDESIDMDRNVNLLWQDKNNWYGIKTFGTGINFEKVVDGNDYPLPNAQTTFPFIANEIYHFSIAYLPDQSIKVYIDGQLVIDTIDQEPFLYDSTSTDVFQTIALKTAKGGERRSVSFFDNLIVTSLGEVKGSDSTILDVPIFKQSDPIWAEVEYDSATSWSENPTIKRWGCAISSMAMILNYYKIYTLPDGTTITPQTLNGWLLSQPDGYVGNGLLNWLAISRLTKQVSEILGTPKLEYSRVGGDLLESTINQIKINQPTILNIPGHFLVANGFTSNLLDLSIIDPSYTYGYLSEHKKELLSTRIFTPSFTDLSYLMIVTDVETDVKILTSDNLVPNGIEQFIESLESDGSFNDSNELSEYKITQIAKPQTDEYQISFTNNNVDNISSEFSILSYDEEGITTIIKNELSQFSNNHNFELSYTKETQTNSNSSQQVTTIKEVVTWESLLQSVKYLKDKSKIEDIYSNYFIKVINWAKIETTENQKRYVTLLTNYLSDVNINEEVKKELLSGLSKINY